MDKLRSIKFFKDYFIKFYLSLDPKVQNKYDHVFVVIRQAERIPKKFFKKISDKKNLYEIRVEYGSNIYRTFCCFDRNEAIILFNSFEKKSQKAPKRVIDKAVSIMKQYFDEKET